MVAAGDGDIEKVKQFLDNGVDPNLQDGNGYSALYGSLYLFTLKTRCCFLWIFRGSAASGESRWK